MVSEAFNLRKQQLVKEVSLLLKSNDCVIIPGFGGFVGNYAASRVHPVTHIFQPAHKQLVFNRSLRSDDGLLIHQLSNSLNLPFADTRSWMNEFTAELNNRIMAGDRITFDEIGSLFADVERNIQFQASYTENFLLDSYGFYPIQAHAINRTPIPERRPETVFIQKDPVISPVRSNRKTWKRVLQLAPIAAIVLFAALNSALPADKGISYADLNPFVTHAPLQAVAIKAISDEVNLNARKADVFVNEEPAFSAESARIFIVAGCYSTKQNADGMLHYLEEKGFEPFILDRTPAGLFRVVYGSYSDVMEASAELSDIRKGLNEEAWLLIR